MCCVGEGKNGGKIAVLDDRLLSRRFIEASLDTGRSIIHRRSSRRAMTKKKQRGTPLSLSKSRSYRVPFCEDKVRTRRGVRRTRLTFGEEIRKLFSFDRAKLTQRKES